MSATGKDLFNFASKFVGSKYVFGVQVPKDNKNWKSPFDCAEFISYVIYQVTGKVYGCYDNSGNPSLADAWTNFFKRDVESGTLIKITVEEALRTVGAILLRYTIGSSVGHIAMSDGKGGTMEANSTKYGCIKSTATGRRWDVAFKVPEIAYEEGKMIMQTNPDINYRLTTPMMKGDAVRKVQQALKAKGYNPGAIDGYYGAGTMNAVKAYQLANGLVPDGEVGVEVLKELSIKC